MLALDPLVIAEHLDEGCKARVLAAAGGTARVFRFVHPILRDVLYRRWSLHEVAEKHRAAGDAIAALCDADVIDEPLAAAEHWLRGSPAGPGGDACAWLARAGQRAWDAGAREIALRLYERARKLAAISNNVSVEVRQALAATLEACGAT